MVDNYTETTRISYGQNIRDSFVGVLFGIILFFASFILLWLNEGNSVRLYGFSDTFEIGFCFS